MAEESFITTVDGLRAVELLYRPIKSLQEDKVVFYQTQARLNGPTMGVLLPERYQPVAELSEKCVHLFRLMIIQLLSTMNRFQDREISFQWISLYMPIPVLKRADTIKGVLEYCTKFSVAPNKVCFELPLRVIYETDEKASENLSALRKRGFHFMLTGFGSRVGSMLNLADFDVDFVMIDASVTSKIGKEKRRDSIIESIITFINNLDAEPIVSDITDSETAEKLFDFGCIYHVGEGAGKYNAQKYVKRKNN